jgi:hypothetical protein
LLLRVADAMDDSLSWVKEFIAWAKRLCRDPSRRGQDVGKFTEQLGTSDLKGS